MPTFDTPAPIPVTIEVVVADVRIIAGDRTDTVVEVRPTDTSHEPDVKAANQTRVDFEGGRLRVKTPKLHNLFGRTGSIDLTIELPAGSDVHATASVADFHCRGRLGESWFATSTGHILLDHTGALYAKTSGGDITVDRADGNADVSTGTGAIRVREITGSAVIKNSNGDSWVGEITGDLRMNAANGDLSVDHAHTAVEAKTANGDVRLNEVVRGSIGLGTSCGELLVGIREGTAAWLDVSTQFGTVRNCLDNADGPASTDETVEVRARNSYGDIVIRRS